MGQEKMVATKLDDFLRRNFRDCKFYVSVGGDRLTITLQEAPYNISFRGRVSASLNYKDKSHFSAEEIDPVHLMSGHTKLLAGSEWMFRSIIKYIKESFKGMPVYYRFGISEQYKDTSAKTGDIVKPTEIDHKTFKGRKRRSVAEDIMPRHLTTFSIHDGVRKFLRREFPRCVFILGDIDRFGIIRVTLFSGNLDVGAFRGFLKVSADNGMEDVNVEDLDPKYLRSNKGLSGEAIKVFEKILNYIKTNFKGNNIIKYSFLVFPDYTILDTVGDISKPTKIEHKTFKGRKRRGVVESIVEGIKDSRVVLIKQFLKRKFPGCLFLTRVEQGFIIEIVLMQGNFDLFRGRIENSDPAGLDDYRIILTGKGFYPLQTVKDMDPKLIRYKNRSEPLSEEAVGVFKEITIFIMRKFIDDGTHFELRVAKNYKNTGVGSISKPTDIDHKTFKGRQRRNVAEAILK